LGHRSRVEKGSEPKKKGGKERKEKIDSFPGWWGYSRRTLKNNFQVSARLAQKKGYERMKRGVDGFASTSGERRKVCPLRKRPRSIILMSPIGSTKIPVWPFQERDAEGLCRGKKVGLKQGLTSLLLKPGGKRKNNVPGC